MSLTERIKEIRLILSRPYFYVNLYPNKSVVVVFESENDNEPRFTFTGPTLKGAVEEAEKWIEHEKKMRTKVIASENGYAHRRHRKSKKIPRIRTPDARSYKRRKKELSNQDKENE